MKYYVNSEIREEKSENKKKLKKDKKQSIITKKDYGLTEGAKVLME